MKKKILLISSDLVADCSYVDHLMGQYDVVALRSLESQNIRLLNKCDLVITTHLHHSIIGENNKLNNEHIDMLISKDIIFWSQNKDFLENIEDLRKHNPLLKIGFIGRTSDEKHLLSAVDNFFKKNDRPYTIEDNRMMHY